MKTTLKQACLLLGLDKLIWNDDPQILESLMKILTPGHKYELSNFENPDATGQTLQFIEKTPAPRAPDEPESGTMVTVNDGTTNEEVLAMIIDRLNNLQSKFPCRENAIAITHVETALLWLSYRTANRKARGVEGKHLK